LKKAGAEENGDARVVVVTCMHIKALARRQPAMETLDAENFFLEKENTYNAHQAYKNSKMANAMFTYELAKQLENTGVTINCLCPGFIPTTELFRNTSNAQRFYRKFILHGLLRFTKATRSIEQGAKAVVEMASGEKLKGVSGKYYKDNQEMKAPEESAEELQKKVYELSARYCHLEGFEPLDAPVPPPPEEPKEKEKKEKAKSEEEEAKEKTTEESEKAEEKTEEKSDKETEKEEKPADSAPEETDDAPKKVAEDDDLKKEAPATEITPAATEIAAQ